MTDALLEEGRESGGKFNFLRLFGITVLSPKGTMSMILFSLEASTGHCSLSSAVVDLSLLLDFFFDFSGLSACSILLSK